MEGIGAEVDALAARLDALPDALRWAVLVLGGVAVGVLLTMLLGRVLDRTVARDGLPRRVLDAIRKPARLFSVALVLGAIVRASSLPDGWRGFLAPLSLAVAILAAGWVVLITTDVIARRSVEGLDLEDEDNLEARRQITQVRVLRRAAKAVIGLLTVGFALWVFEPVRHVGTSLFASAGVAGIILGLAARPVFSNLIAGVQIALTQPIRIDDVVIVEDEWGWIEEIASTYVVVRIWDLRRMVLPLSYFIENPFQNWTRESANIIGSVMFYVDYTAPVAQIRDKFEEAVKASSRWDGKTVVLQVIDTDKDTVQLRGLCSSRNSPLNWDLRCEVREKVLSWLQESYPEALPKHRIDIDRMPEVDNTPIPT